MDLIFENVKKIVFPEEWLKIDISLSKQEVFTLMMLDRRGEIIMSRIAEYVNISMSTATGIVDRLVKNGYVERNRSETDRRIVMISLSKKGKALVAEIKNIGVTYAKQISEVLTDEEREFLFKIAKKILGAMNAKAESAEQTDENQTFMKKVEIE
ncbi:MAG: MarR family transcriptional regulator [Chitinivibrionales bacterium]|nr:MarR family transcriptional regulator [Chitinivibrionales bacterium]